MSLPINILIMCCVWDISFKLSYFLYVTLFLSCFHTTIYVAYMYTVIAYLSYDVTFGSEITPCNKMDKPLVVYRFTGNVMKSITTLDHNDKIITFLGQK